MHKSYRILDVFVMKNKAYKNRTISRDILFVVDDSSKDCEKDVKKEGEAEKNGKEAGKTSNEVKTECCE